MMKIIFMGTPDFSVGTLEALIEAGHEVCLVVTQPDKPKGRGKEMQPTPGRCYGCDCIWTDPSKVNSGNDTIWVHQCACLTSSKVPWCSTDPVGDHQRRKCDRSNDHADG
jgi:hypothetical protein